MTTQHTPGPWHHGLHHHGHLAVQAENGRLVTLCGVIAHDDAQLENHANSRLISAAPDLLAALQDLLNATEETYDNRHEREAAIDAIAKATGAA